MKLYTDDSGNSYTEYFRVDEGAFILQDYTASLVPAQLVDTYGASL